MEHLESENGETVDGPGWGLSVDARRRLDSDGLELIEEIGVDELDHVSTLLIGGVDSALDGESLDGVDERVADNVLEMPLNSVDPVLAVEEMFELKTAIGVDHRSIDIVRLMIVVDSLIEYRPIEISFLHEKNEKINR